MAVERLESRVLLSTTSAALLNPPLALDTATAPKTTTIKANTTVKVAPTISAPVPTAGTWTVLTNTLPTYGGGGDNMEMLLPDGQVFVHGGGGNASNIWDALTPNVAGSYMNGIWSALAPMNVDRLYFTSDVLPNGDVFVLGGEYSGPQTISNFTPTGEIYDPATNVWTVIPPDPKGQFGDDPSAVLPDGDILCGDIADAGTEIFNPITLTWTTGPTKVHDDPSDEESWLTLPDGSILTYDIFSSINAGTGEAERYIPSTNTWVDASAGTLPILSTPGNGYELGGGLLVDDGTQAFYPGANGSSAFFNTNTNM